MLATVLLRSYVLICFVPLLSGAAFSGRRAVDLRSTYAVSLVTGFGPFPCSSVRLSRQFSGQVRSLRGIPRSLRIAPPYASRRGRRATNAASRRRPRPSGA